MDANFRALVNNDFECTLSKKEIESLDIIFDGHKAQVIHDHKSLEIELLKSDFNNRTYVIKIKGVPYEVHIEDELDMLIEEMGLAVAEAVVSNEIHAPMPGLLLEISVSEGQSVEEGEVVCVLEAMKMENALLSPRNGVIKTIHVAKAESVEKGALLIDFE